MLFFSVVILSSDDLERYAETTSFRVTAFAPGIGSSCKPYLSK
jgi:hypothetical protein